MPRGGVITGRISDEFGEPITGATVLVERYQYGPWGRALATSATGSGPFSAVTNDRGEYRLYGLSSGEFAVSARLGSLGAQQLTLISGTAALRDRAETFLPTYYPGTTSADQAEMIRVAAGQEFTADFRMLPGRMRRVPGTATLSNGRPAAGLNVYLGVTTANSRDG